MANSQQQDCSESVTVSPSFSSFLKIHGDKAMSAFRIAVKENIHLSVMENERINIKASRNSLDKLKVILMSDPVKLIHSLEVTYWLSKNTASWLDFTNSLRTEYLCAIYTEKDFSKSYVFIAPHHYKKVYAKINNFLSLGKAEALPEDQNSEESLPDFVDYQKSNEEMALNEEKEKLSVSDSPPIKIDRNEECLEDFESGQRKITSQSCLLNASQAKLFSTFGDEILSNIERDYKVRGNVFQSASSMNSLILNQQTDLIFIVCPVADGCPVDNYINIEYNLPDRLTEYTVGKKLASGHKIWKGVTCNQPFNQRLHVELPLNGFTIKIETALEECFRILHDDNSFHSKITGIHLSMEDLEEMNQFCCHLVAALQKFDQMHLSDPFYKCIAVMVDNPEIQIKVTKTISEMIEDKPEDCDGGEKEDIENSMLGAIPKISRGTQHRIHSNKPEVRRDKPVLWVQLFSDNPENLRLAFDTLMNKLGEDTENSTTVKIHRNKMESVLFFFDKEIIKDVPDIKDQLAKCEENIISVVIPENLQTNLRPKFRKLLKKIQKVQIDVEGNQEKTFLNSIISKCNHDFPDVKCTYLEARSNILIESLNLKNCEMAARKMKSLLGQPFYKENTNSEELPEKTRENLGAEFEPDQLFFAPTYLTIRVLHSDILSVDAEAIACPISSSKAQNSYICRSIFRYAGTKVQEELMACYEMYSDKKLPEGEVILIPAENLQCKFIVFVCCPQYIEQKYDDRMIQNILTSAVCNMLIKVERQELHSVAFPVLGSGNFGIPFDLCLEALLGGITSFVNQSSNKHLQVISFVDIEETNCNLIMNYFEIYNIPFQNNLEKPKPQRQVKERKQRSRRGLIQPESSEQDLNSNPGPLESFTSDILNSNENFDTSQTSFEEEDQAQGIHQNQIHRTSFEEEYQTQSMPQSQFNRASVEEEYQTRSQPQISQSLDGESYELPDLPPLRPPLDDEPYHLPSLPPLRNPEKTDSFEQDLNPNPGPLVSNTLNILDSYKTFNTRQTPFEEEQQAVSMPQSRISLVPCPVCFKPVTNPEKFEECLHEYCRECIREWLQVIGQKCPLCMNTIPQPPGEMRVRLSKRSLPGFEEFQTYEINYNIPNGIQQVIHPNPGKMYHGVTRKAYLPADEKGECILKMLQKAFKCHLIFSVGDSLSTKKSDVVVWNGILHKSHRTGGPTLYGYPDPDYLDYVTAQLIEIGITPESVESERIEIEIKSTIFS